MDRKENKISRKVIKKKKGMKYLVKNKNYGRGTHQIYSHKICNNFNML